MVKKCILLLLAITLAFGGGSRMMMVAASAATIAPPPSFTTNTSSSKMTIKSITTSILKDEYTFVHVVGTVANDDDDKETEVEGWGQAEYSKKNGLNGAIADAIHAWHADVYLGATIASIDDIVALNQKAWEAQYKSTGTLLARSVAGIDTAVWDLFARSQNMRVCELLLLLPTEGGGGDDAGGACKDFIEVYGSSLDRSSEPVDIVNKAVAVRDKYGVNAFKLKIAQRMGHNVDVYPNRTEEVITLAREMLGDDATLMVDANGGYDDVEHAMVAARLLHANNFTWLEEPFPFWDYASAVDLINNMSAEFGGRDSIVDIALGEQEYRLDVWQRNLEQSMQFAQPDVHYVGGVSRILPIAAAVAKSSSSVTFIPHSPNPSMIDVFVLHLLSSLPSAFRFMEFACVDSDNPPTGSDFFDAKVFELRDGAITMPTGPGWGVTFKSGLLAEAENRTSSS